MTLDEIKNLLCAGEFSSLTISWNEEASNYTTVGDTLKHLPYYDIRNFVSPEEYQKCIDTNSIWTAHYYPKTPVGFNVIHASTFEALHAALVERASS
jgi:hypothetical protein